MSDERMTGTEFVAHVNAMAKEELARADLLPVVKPLVWAEHCDQTGGCHSVSAYNPNLWGYVIEASDLEGPFGLWSPDEGEGVDSPRLGLDYPTVEAAKAAAQADYEARIRACIDMIDPAELVAGAYEAGFKDFMEMKLIGTPQDDPALSMLRALTGTEAQDALDAAIAKAVNAKLEEVANVDLPFPKYQSVEYQAGWDAALLEMYEAILAMKEPE